MQQSRKATIGVLLALGLLPASGACAEVSFIARQAATEINSTDLIGRSVLNASGETIGNINYILLDESARVATVTIGVGGFLGMGEKNVGVPYSSLKSDTVAGKSVFRAEVTRADLDAAPAFAWIKKPTAVGIEDGVKSVWSKAGEAAKDLSKRASDAVGKM